jgi:hypothetical protein
MHSKCLVDLVLTDSTYWRPTFGEAGGDEATVTEPGCARRSVTGVVMDRAESW